MSRNYAPMLNCTGRELPVDMTCPNTVECFKFDAEAESFFFDENNTLSLPERVKAIYEFAAKHAPGHNLIIENNELGRALVAAAGQMEVQLFVMSHKQPNGLHWYYGFTDRLAEPKTDTPSGEAVRVQPSDEWLKTAVGTNQPDRDFQNVWVPASDQSIIKANPGVNIGGLPTDADMAGLEQLSSGAILEKGLTFQQTPEEGLQLEVLRARIEQAVQQERARGEKRVDDLKAQLYSKISALEEQLATTRCLNGNLADDIFESIKHGDEKHQAWLKDSLTRYFQGFQPLPEDVFSQRIPSSVQFVNGNQGQDQ